MRAADKEPHNRVPQRYERPQLREKENRRERISNAARKSIEVSRPKTVDTSRCRLRASMHRSTQPSPKRPDGAKGSNSTLFDWPSRRRPRSRGSCILVPHWTTTVARLDLRLETTFERSRGRWSFPKEGRSSTGDERGRGVLRTACEPLPVDTGVKTN